MPIKKFKFKKAIPVGRQGFFRPVHLQALAVLIIYFFASNFVFVGAIANPNILISFFVPLTFGTLLSFAFLYLFGHEDFFHTMASLEKEEKGREEKLLGKFGHFGNIIVCMIISTVAGPIILALAIRFLFSEKENRYLIAFISCLASTIITVGLAKGLFNYIFSSL